MSFQKHFNGINTNGRAYEYIHEWSSPEWLTLGMRIFAFLLVLIHIYTFVLLLKGLLQNTLVTDITRRCTLFIKQLWVLQESCHMSPRKQTQFEKRSFRATENVLIFRRNGAMAKFA